jgi:hypothetical protein
MFKLLSLLTFYITFDYSFYLKILILIYKIISSILNFFSDKSNHNKYMIVLKKIE